MQEDNTPAHDPRLVRRMYLKRNLPLWSPMLSTKECLGENESIELNKLMSARRSEQWRNMGVMHFDTRAAEGVL